MRPSPTRREGAITTAERDAPLLLLQPIGHRVAGRAVILERQEFARHGDLDAVALGIGLAPTKTKCNPNGSLRRLGGVADENAAIAPSMR